MTVLHGKRILVTGGTGSLGKVLLRRLLDGGQGEPERIVIFSRDEGKQHAMRMAHQRRAYATDEIIYHATRDRLEFRIGDVRDYHSVAAALRGIDIVVNAAALKQVPTCEYFPYEAVMTNVGGPENIVRAIRELDLPVETVVGISTDKAVKPVNVMGMTKSLQERVLIRANLDRTRTRWVVVRYGNVLASRGSVIPLFHDQIRNGGPVTITDPRMTRFLLSLDEACDAIFAAVRDAAPGETYVPLAPSARIVDVARALIDDRPIECRVTGIRPGEKLHEILVSEEEALRTVRRGAYHVIASILPELRGQHAAGPFLGKEHSSADEVLSLDAVRHLIGRRGLDIADASDEDLLR